MYQGSVFLTVTFVGKKKQKPSSYVPEKLWMNYDGILEKNNTHIFKHWVSYMIHIIYYSSDFYGYCCDERNRDFHEGKCEGWQRSYGEAACEDMHFLRNVFISSSLHNKRLKARFVLHWHYKTINTTSTKDSLLIKLTYLGYALQLNWGMNKLLLNYNSTQDMATP